MTGPRLALGVFALFTFLGWSPASGEEPVPIEGGFAYADMEFAVLYPNEVLGTIINRSGRDYRQACFMMKLYNTNDQLLKTVDFCVGNLPNNQSQAFRTRIEVDPRALKGYKMVFKGGR